MHAGGDGSTLDVIELPEARLGSLICWENYMPLARYALYGAGAEILAAPTWDRGEPWLSTLRHVAKEGRMYRHQRLHPLPPRRHPRQVRLQGAHLPDAAWLNPGDSASSIRTGRCWRDRRANRKASSTPRSIRRPWRGSRYQLDVAGHYARPDVFDLRIDRRPKSITRTLARDVGEAGTAQDAEDAASGDGWSDPSRAKETS